MNSRELSIVEDLEKEPESDILSTPLFNIRDSFFHVLEGGEEPTERARKDFVYFLENAVRDEKIKGYIRLAPFHKEIVSILLDPNINFFLFLAPRGAGKSILTAAYVAWIIGTNRNVRVILVGNTEEQAICHAGGVEAILRSPEYIRVFGDLMPRGKDHRMHNSWSARYKTVVRPRSFRHPTIFSAGVGSADVEGKRGDILICDDIVTEDTARYPAQREFLETWFFKTLLPTRDARGAQVIVIGTPYGREDLYTTISAKMGNNPKFMARKFPALYEEEGVTKSYWPDMWPVEKLLELQQENWFSFNSQFLLNPVDLSQAMLRREWVKIVDESQVPLSRLTTFAGIDPNTTKSAIGDYFSVAVIGQDPELDKYYLLDLLYTKSDIKTVSSLARGMLEKWRPRAITVETGAYQSLVKDILEAELGFPLIPIPTRNRAKVERIVSMSTHFIAGRVMAVGSFAKGELVPWPNLEPFFKEWEVFPTGHDDALDAVDKALEHVLGYGNRELAEAVGTPEIVVPKHQPQTPTSQGQRTPSVFGWPRRRLTWRGF